MCYRNVTFIIQHMLDWYSQFEMGRFSLGLSFLGNALGRLYLVLCIVKMRILCRILTRQAIDSPTVRCLQSPVWWYRSPVTYEYGNKQSTLHCPPVVLISSSHLFQPLCLYMEGSHRSQVIGWLETGFAEAFSTSLFLLRSLFLKCSNSPVIEFWQGEGLPKKVFFCFEASTETWFCVFQWFG